MCLNSHCTANKHPQKSILAYRVHSPPPCAPQGICFIWFLVANPLLERRFPPLFLDHCPEGWSNSAFLRGYFLDIYWFCSLPAIQRPVLPSFRDPVSPFGAWDLEWYPRSILPSKAIQTLPNVYHYVQSPFFCINNNNNNNNNNQRLRLLVLI